MALVLGTNCGFVTTAPTSDEGGGNYQGIDSRNPVTKDTSPATATRITEIGWWCGTATEEANFRVALYAADGAVVPGEAGTRLYISSDAAKGTTAGWKSIAVDWAISANTSYWIAFGLDNTATATFGIYIATNGLGCDVTLNEACPNPYGGGALFYADGAFGIYAVWTDQEAPAGTNSFINIGDGLNLFLAEYLGCWLLSPFFLFSIVEILKHIG